MSMIDTIRQHPIGLAIAALGLAILASMSFSVVPETKQAVILSYGQIQRVVNPYSANQAFGATGAGLTFRIPFIEQIELIDKRILSVEMDDQTVLSTDQLRIQVDAYARYRIVAPARMYSSIRSQEALESQLSNLLSSSLRNELGKRTFAALLSPERGQVMANIQRSLAREAQRYGVQIVDVRINRADLPAGSSRNSAFNRMRTAREQEATAIIAEGDKQAQIISAQANGERARIYATSFGKDPEFYAFYRAMQSYRQTFLTRGAGASTFVLPPGEGYLREFGGR
ncbi:MAG: protease modulator HflC [Sphingopyxis sp.]